MINTAIALVNDTIPWHIPKAAPVILDSTELLTAIEINDIKAVHNAIAKPLQITSKVHKGIPSKLLPNDVKNTAGIKKPNKITEDFFTPNFLESQGVKINGNKVTIIPLKEFIAPRFASVYHPNPPFLGEVLAQRAKSIRKENWTNDKKQKAPTVKR